MHFVLVFVGLAVSACATTERIPVPELFIDEVSIEGFGDARFWGDSKPPRLQESFLARKILEEVAEEVCGEYAREAQSAWEPMTRKFHIEPAVVTPTISMTANENWIEFTLRYVADYRRRRSTKDRLFTRILEEIDKRPSEVNIASVTLKIGKLAPLEVHLKDPKES